jgi:hypothetical protein
MVGYDYWLGWDRYGWLDMIALWGGGASWGDWIRLLV